MMFSQIIFLFLLPLFVLLLAISIVLHVFYLVPFVPSNKKVIDMMVEVARLKKGETVFDLGCGDGRLLRAAETKMPIQAIGFEIAPLVYFLALVRKSLWNSRMKIIFKSMYKAPLREANVIFCYLLPDAMQKFVHKFKHECKPGTRIISQTFHIPGLEPEKVIPRDLKKGTPSIYVYSF